MLAVSTRPHIALAIRLRFCLEAIKIYRYLTALKCVLKCHNNGLNSCVRHNDNDWAGDTSD